MIRPLLLTLSEVHAQSLIHWDIAPDNLMLEHGEVRLLDFGCARDVSNDSSTLTVTLKHGYAPLEQYSQGDQGAWTDIYAAREYQTFEYTIIP